MGFCADSGEYEEVSCEETFEALEAIEEGDAEHAKEELGDVIMNAVEIAALYEKQGKFSVDEVLDGAAEKLIRRHPHVFEKKELSLDQLNVQWDKIKKSEGKKEKLSHEEKFAKMQKLLESIAPEYESMVPPSLSATSRSTISPS